VAGLLNQNPYGGGLLGRPQPQGLLGGIANFFRPWTPEDRARVAAVMPPDLAPTQIVKGMVGGAADLAMQANQAMPWGGNYPQAIGIDPQAGTIDPSVMVPFAQNVAGMATTGSLAAPAVRNATGMGIRAYHGSPHDFDRFSMDKIGTGEGAQAYGHGLYFAESPDVAKSYRDALSTPRSFKTDAEGKAFAYLKSAGGDVDAALSDLDARQRYMSPAAFAETKAYLTDIKSGKIAPPKTDGHTYEVDINASPDELIDYDADWSGQPDVVKRHFAHLAKNGDGPRGSDLAARIESQVWLEEARNAGIKGIRYKDAGSRAISPAADQMVSEFGSVEKALEVAQQRLANARSPRDAIKAEEMVAALTRTHNYVVFDDNIIDILKKYGIAGLTAGGAGAAMLGGSSDPASAAAPSYTTGGRF